jgi:hypothetical protein
VTVRLLYLIFILRVPINLSQPLTWCLLLELRRSKFGIWQESPPVRHRKYLCHANRLCDGAPRSRLARSTCVKDAEILILRH